MSELPVPRLLAIALLLGLGGCGGANSPTDVTPPPPPACVAGQYLNRDFPDAAVTRDIVFSQVTDDFGVHVLRMDVYEPVGDTAPQRPAILWLFGGSFKTGDKSQLAFFANEFALRGYVTAAADYRKLQQYERVSGSQAQDAAQSDAQSAIRFLRARAADFSIDAARIAVGGWSAGSITAFNVGYRPEFVGDNVANGGFAQTVGTVVGLDGFSKSAGIQRNDPPFVLFRAGDGANDDPEALPALIAEANAAAITYAVEVVPGARHQDLIVHPYDESIVVRAAQFLRTNLACR